MNTAEKGREGEEKAAAYLEAQGYRIIRRNYRTRTGEIDAIAEKGGEIVFFEIKCWSGYDATQLENSVNLSKRKKIINTARRFLSETYTGEERRVRFDLMFVDGQTGSIDHYENAFTESGVV